MNDGRTRNGVGLLAILAFAVGAYALVLGGITPLGGDAQLLLAAVAAVATVGAFAAGERVPAGFGAVAALGFVAGALGNGVVATVAAVLAVVGGVGFALTAGWVGVGRLSGTAGT